MSELATIQNDTGILIYLDGKPHKFERGTEDYKRVVLALQDTEDLESAVREVINYKRKPISTETVGFEITDDSVIYEGETLPKVLAGKVRSITEQGLPLESFRNFWENLRENPSNSSVEELLTFLEYKELPITSDGFFLAYKGVRGNGYSHHGNPEVKVIQGKVDEGGRILNEVGETIEILRRHVCDNKKECAESGLHVGSLNYALGYGPKYFVVKVNPKDVVSVPVDSSHQKLRTCKYEVVSEYVEEIKDSVTKEDGSLFVDPSCNLYNGIKEFLKDYLFDWEPVSRFIYFENILDDLDDSELFDDDLDIYNNDYSYYFGLIAAIVVDLGYIWGYDDDGDQRVVYGTGPHKDLA